MNDLQVLAFKLGSQEYGININKVQELRSYEPVTRIANCPKYILGLVNLRGIIVPIIDMRVKFNLGTPTYDQFTVMVILNMDQRVMGMVVDSVQDVITLSPQQIKPAPEMGKMLTTNYLLGMGCVDQRMLILVDIELMLNTIGLFDVAEIQK